MHLAQLNSGKAEVLAVAWVESAKVPDETPAKPGFGSDRWVGGIGGYHTLPSPPIVQRSGGEVVVKYPVLIS